jgi:predicted amino acid-binding ACT domain protein
MAITVKSVKLWVLHGPDRIGFLADALEPLASAGANLRVVMAYCNPGQPARAAIEVFPVSGKRAEAAARAAGLSPSDTACLLVEGDDRPGLGAALGRAIAQAGVSMSFLIAETVGRKFSAVIGFGSETDAATAAKAAKSAARPARRS